MGISEHKPRRPITGGEILPRGGTYQPLTAKPAPQPITAENLHRAGRDAARPKIGGPCGPAGDRIDLTSIDEVIYLRVFGLGNATRSVALRDVAEGLLQRGCRRMVIDLGPCRGLDSTFMGTLLMLANNASELNKSAKKPNVPVVLVNVDAHVQTQLTMLGLLQFDELLRVKTEPVEFPDCRMEALPEKPVVPARRLNVICDAHERLIKADRRNEEQFGPFLRALLAELDTKKKQ